MASRKFELATSALSHLLWGLHPVLSRYLQTQPSPPLNGLNLLAVGQCLALGVNLLGTACAARAGAAAAAVHSSAPPAGDAAPTESPLREHGQGAGALPANDEENGGHALLSLQSNPPAAADSHCESSCSHRRRGCCRDECTAAWLRQPAARMALLFGSMAALRAATNMLSAKFTSAFNVQMVAMAGPLVTSIASSVLIGEAVPWTLWPTLLVAGCGEALVLAAQAGAFVSAATGDGELGGGGGGGLTARDGIGLGLQFASLLFSGVARVVMKAS